MPKEEWEAIKQEAEISNYLRQSHISKKNVARLKELAVSSNERIAEHVALVREIARIKPYKRRRLKVLRCVSPPNPPRSGRLRAVRRCDAQPLPIHRPPDGPLRRTDRPHIQL